MNFASVETWSREIGIRLEIKPRLRERDCAKLLDVSVARSFFVSPRKKKKEKEKKEKDLGAVLVIDLSDYEALEQSSVASVVLLLLLFSFLGVRD